MENNDRIIGQPAPENTPTETTIIPVGGAPPATYIPATLETIERDLIPTFTDAQRRVLVWTSKGLGRQYAAKEAHVSPDSIEAWCKQSKNFRTAYYSTMAAAKTFSAEAIRNSAVADGLLHYTTISELAQGDAQSARDRAVKLQAAKEALILAGAYRDDALAPGESLEITAIRIRRSREEAKARGPEPAVEGAFTEKP